MNIFGKQKIPTPREALDICMVSDKLGQKKDGLFPRYLNSPKIHRYPRVEESRHYGKRLVVPYQEDQDKKYIGVVLPSADWDSLRIPTPDGRDIVMDVIVITPEYARTLESEDIMPEKARKRTEKHGLTFMISAHVEGNEHKHVHYAFPPNMRGKTIRDYIDHVYRAYVGK